MSAMRRCLRAMIGLAACGALAVGAATAQTARPAKRNPGKRATPPTAEQLIAKYVRAIGGRSALEKTSSRRTVGTMDPGGGTFLSLEIIEKSPDKFLSVVSVPEVGTVMQGFDGKIGWESDPNQGVQELTGAMLAAVRRNSQFYRWLRMKELFGKLEASGTTMVGDREAFVMEATPQEGYAEKFYFDTVTGFLVRRDYKLDTPDGVVSFETFYDDYRDVDGVKLPFALRRVGPDNVLILKFTEIKQNVELDDARFAKPVSP